MVKMLTRKRILGITTTFILWILGVLSEDTVKSIFNNSTKFTAMSTYKIVILIIGALVILSMLIYWFLKDLNRKINDLNSRLKWASAILTENTKHNKISKPTRESLLAAGITIDDMLYAGYSKEEIKIVFPEYH